MFGFELGTSSVLGDSQLSMAAASFIGSEDEVNAENRANWRFQPLLTLQYEFKLGIIDGLFREVYPYVPSSQSLRSLDRKESVAVANAQQVKPYLSLTLRSCFNRF